MGEFDTVIVSLGGSLIVPNGGIDIEFLKKFNQFIRKQIVETNRRFFIVCGGGQTARHYMKAGKEVSGVLTEVDSDWLGIHTTRLNAQLLRTIFQDVSHPIVVDNYEKELEIKDERVIIGAGWKPGCSTDFDAVLAAEKFKAKTLVNLSNVSYVYDKDPKKHPNAEKKNKLTWSEYREIVGDKWTSGMNAPFDPIAAKRAEELGLQVVILNGKDLENVKKSLDGKQFSGTLIG